MKVADYEDAQIVTAVIKKRNKLNYLQNLIYKIQSIPANELVEKWDAEARQIWQNGYNYSNADDYSVERGKMANRAYLTSIEKEWNY
jgi:hypothetical protein